MIHFIDNALGRSRTVLLALVAILIAGTITYLNIPKEAEPDVEIPVIYVLMNHEGISPEDAERLLVRPMEQELRSLEGLKEMRANAHEGGASVTVEFEAGTVDTDKALQDVREKVDTAKAKLPQETDEPQVHEVKLSKQDPMMVFTLSGNLPERTLITIARNLQDKVEGITGVLEVDMFGDREELMEVVVDPLMMESYGLSQQELFNLVSRNNRLVPAGALDSAKGRFPVKVPGVFESVEDVMTLPIKVEGNRVVHFSDVATVRRSFKDAESYARIDGKPAIGLEVAKRAGANIIDTIGQVLSVIEAERQYWPENVTVTVTRDKSEDIESMLTDLQNNVLSAVLLVVIVIIGILGIRTAGLVGVAIPGSFLTGILLIGAFGLTINIVVLFSLIMAVGMLVDGAIVVTEFADRKMAEGMERHQAYRAASRRMAWPIISATATTLAAFFPLVFWPGVVGQFMKYLPITLIAVLSASLAMALIFVPTLGSIFGKPGTLSDNARKDLAAAETGDLNEIGGWTGKYLNVLRSALRHPWRVLGIAVAILVAIFTAYSFLGKGTEFFPDVEPKFANLEIRARGDLSTEEKDAFVREVEHRIRGLEGVESVYARSGGGGRQSAEDVIGRVQLNFHDWEVRPPADEILAEARRRTADLAGIRVETREPEAGPGQGKPIQIQLSSRFPETLAPAVEKVRTAMEGLDGLQDIEDSRPLPGIEWRVKVDRAKAARFGADVTTVGNTVQLVTNGVKIGEYRPNDTDDEIDIRVRYPYEDRTLDQLEKLRIPTNNGMAPIANFVRFEPAPQTGTIERTDMRRTMTVAADVASGVLVSKKVEQMKQQLPSLGLDRRVRAEFKGEDEEQRKAREFLVQAGMAALFIMAIILVTQFNSFYQAFLILSAVVFSTGGVFLGHLLLQKPFGIVMSGVGVIALAGIVVNNNIVLIDTYNVLRQSGMSPFEAVMRTGAQRLRPVMLTTVTTILGLMPMVLGINIDLIHRDVTIGGPSTQWWVQLASAVAGGLAFATLLTLIMTPAMLILQANLHDRRVHRKREKAARGPVKTDGDGEGTEAGA